jgi:hypothetical protein
VNDDAMDALVWNGDASPPGAAVLVDVDGVIADASHRQHHLAAGRNDWKAFFDAAGDDPPIAAGRALLDALADDVLIVLLTARPVRLRDVTLDWLARHGFRWDLLVMRPKHVSGPAREFKAEAVRALLGAGFELRFALEDDARNVEVLAGLGVPTVHVHSGYYA